MKYVELKNAKQAAIAAGYSPKTAKVIGHENLTKPYLKARIDEIEKQIGLTIGNTIATVEERKQILTEIARASFADVSEGKFRSRAVQSVRISKFITKQGAQEKTSISLHSPIQAISELNKMERLYSEGMTVNVDNRKLEVIVQSEDARKMLKELEESGSGD